MKMSKLDNLPQSGLRRSERMRKFQNSKKVEESHPKKINAFTSKILLFFYTVISTVFTLCTLRFMEPKPDATTYDKFINMFHDANDLYGGTLNQLNLSVFATSSNENYTYPQAM